MLLVDEPGTCRLFVNDLRGPLYSASYDGRTVRSYLDLGDSKWSLDLDFSSRGRDWGFGSFAFHPQFNQPGTPGFGKFYTILETSNKARKADFAPWNETLDKFDTVLLEWTALDPAAAVVDCGPPRELIPHSATAHIPQRRAHRLQPARRAGRSRLRQTLRQHRRRWITRRSVRPRAKP